MNIIDLTHTINKQTPVYPGDPVVDVVASGDIEEDGFVDHKVTFGTHVGTHIDAPAHMIIGGKKLNDIMLRRFIVPAICIDVTEGFDADVIAATEIEEGGAVLFYTGMGQYFTKPNYWQGYQVMDQSCIDTLVSKKVGLIGVDAGSVDKEEDFPIHKALLGSDILIIENLAPTVQELVGKHFELIALPLKLEFDGAPARVIARI